MDTALELLVTASEPSVEELCGDCAVVTIRARHVDPRSLRYGCLRDGRNYDYEWSGAVYVLGIARDLVGNLQLRQ